MEKLIKIDDLLKDYGMDRAVMINATPSYQAIFNKIDKYYEQYEKAPTEALYSGTEKITLAFVEKMKSEHPDMFSLQQEEEEVIVTPQTDGIMTKHKDNFMFYIDEGDQDSIDDLFTLVGEKNTRYLLSYENFKAFNKALRSKNELIIFHLKEIAEKQNIYGEMVAGRNGENLNLIISTKNIPLIKGSLLAIKDREDAVEMLNKNMVDQQILEIGDEELVSVVDDILDKEEEEVSTPKKQKKTSTTVKEQAPLKQIVDMINAGKIEMDTPLVVKLERKFAIRVIDSPEDMAIGQSKTYKFIVPTSVMNYFDAKVIFTDNDYTIYEAEKTVFETQFGLSIYELGICWFNLINMVSVDDILALLYLANISTILMVDRNNQQLRNDYLGNLKVILQQPDSNKIAGRYFQMKEANLLNLKRSGFLDEQFCPTKLLYAAVVLHSFPFPAFTHPFEFVKIESLSSMFQFQTVKGEFGNEAFYTDGDVLFHNYTDTSVIDFFQALSDTSRTIILNLKSNSRSDISKSKSSINHFIPVIYSVPKSGVSMPTFSLRILDMENRKINWGVYELGGEEDRVYVNSFALSNALAGINSEDYSISQYKGVLSDTIFSSPTQGVVMQYKNTYLVIRGLRQNSFLSENYGKNWKKYYEQMYGKQHLVENVLDKLDPDMVKAIYSSSNTLVVSTQTGLQYNVEKTYEPTYKKEAIKPAPQVKKVVVPVSKRDDRVYINKSFSREKLDKSLWDVYDAISPMTGEVRDEAILDELYARKITRIFPNQLVYLGFGLKEYVVDKPERIRFKDKYKLTIPIILSFQPTYYIEKI